MNKPDPIIIGIIFITIIIFVGVIFAAFRLQEAPIVQYKNTDTSRPLLKIGETNFDFGKMKVSESKFKEIRIENKGENPLIISNLYTSCDCTFVQLVVDGKESPKFAMQRNFKWRGEIPPGTLAVLKITYEPRLMPVKGDVTREIIFKTNDPANPQVNIRFRAEVE